MKSQVSFLTGHQNPGTAKKLQLEQPLSSLAAGRTFLDLTYGLF